MPLVGAFVVLLAFLGVHLLEGGSIVWLVSLPSAVLVVGTVLGALLMSTGLTRPARQLTAVLFGGDVDDGKPLTDALRTVIVAAPLAGFLGAAVGSLRMVAVMYDPSALGPAVALIYLSLLYSAVITLFAYASATLVATREAGRVETPSLAHGSLVAMVSFGLCFAVMGFTLYVIASVA